VLASAGAGIITVLPIVKHIARTQPDRDHRPRWPHRPGPRPAGHRPAHRPVTRRLHHLHLVRNRQPRRSPLPPGADGSHRHLTAWRLPTALRTC